MKCSGLRVMVFSLALTMLCACAMATMRDGSKGEWQTGEISESEFASRWGYGSTDQGHICVITGDESVKQTGDASIKFDTGSGFDAWAYFPNTKDMDLDCKNDVGSISFLLHTENKNGWGPDCWVIVQDAEGRRAKYNTLRSRIHLTLKGWVQYSLPLGPDAARYAESFGWKIDAPKDFDWEHVALVEFHEDTGGYGFVMYLDDVRFNAQGGEPVKWWLSSLEKPDLTVTYAERIPRYHRYMPEYKSVYPLLQPEREDLKRWPDEGEEVKYLVHVRNEGFVESPATDFVCTIDGETVKNMTLDPMGAKTEKVIEVPWKWKQGAFVFEAKVDTGNKLDEISKKNNILEFQTDAYTLFAFVEKKCAEQVCKVNNQLGSFSFEDWLRSSTVDRLNWMMRDSTYDFAPKGTKVRCRIDGIIYVDDVKDLPRDEYPPDSSDGSWSYPERSWVEYCNLANIYMWALCHELTHQFGIIDNYQLDLPGKNNMVNGKPFGQPDGGSMGGGRTYGRGRTHYSDMTVAGYEATYGYRRGYFGEYIWNVPDKNVVQLRINKQPVKNAEVSVYQKKFAAGEGRDKTGNGTIPNEPVMTGKTDDQGRYVFENRPTYKEYTTATGCTSKPSPFGYIDVVGRNGLLMLRTQVDGKWYYGFMDVGLFNVEYARGHKEQGNYVLDLMLELDEVRK